MKIGVELKVMIRSVIWMDVSPQGVERPGAVRVLLYWEGFG